MKTPKNNKKVGWWQETKTSKFHFWKADGWSACEDWHIQFSKKQIVTDRPFNEKTDCKKCQKALLKAQGEGIEAGL